MRKPQELTTRPVAHSQAELWQAGTKLGTGDAELLKAFAWEVNSFVAVASREITSTNQQDNKMLHDLITKLRQQNRALRSQLEISDEHNRKFLQGCLVGNCRSIVMMQKLLPEGSR